jgi:hypothetical protein
MIPGPNWARRYGAHHRRSCARPGCGAPAAATLRFQPTQREAWLVDLDERAARTEGDLCARHAAALVLPRGWELHDERRERLPAGATPAAPGAATARRRPRSVRRARPRRLAAVSEPAPVLPLDFPGAPRASARPAAEDASAAHDATEPHDATAPHDATEPHDATAPAAHHPPGPVSGEQEVAGDKLADVLQADTPLLRRAFRNVVPIDDDES